MQLHGMVPTDPFLLQRLGDRYEQEGDKSQAFSYYYDVSPLVKTDEIISV